MGDQEAMAARLSFTSLYAFTRNFWPVINSDPYTDNFHIKYVCEELEDYVRAIVNREYIEDLLVNIPPGASKSTMISQMFPAFLWLHAPWAIVIGSSYHIDLSTEHASKSMEIIQSDQYKRWFGPLFKPLHGKPLIMVKSKEKLYVNNFGGQRFSTSTGGMVTGKHAHVILRDDPVDPFKAESAAYRKQEERFNDRTLPTRKKNKLIVPTITVMQRVHEEDTSGRDLKKGIEMRHICLPARLSDNVKPEVLREDYVDGLLDPNRMSDFILQGEKKRLGSYGFAGQYQQRPAPEGGGVIKAEWFPRYEPREVDWSKQTVHFYLDSAYTEKQTNDPSALMAFSRLGDRLLIVDVAQVWMELPQLLKFIPSFMQACGANNYSSLVVEYKASGPSVIQMLKKTGLTVIADKLPKGEDKLTRVNAIAPLLEAGRVELPNRGKFVEDFLNECTTFPNGDHDDRVDCLTGAVRKMLTNRPRRRQMRGGSV